MTDTEIRVRAEAYIDEAVADLAEKPSAEERDAAVKRVEEASRELLAAREEERELAAR